DGAGRTRIYAGPAEGELLAVVADHRAGADADDPARRQRPVVSGQQAVGGAVVAAAEVCPAGSDVVDVDVDLVPAADDGDAAAEEVFGLGRGRERGRRGDGGSDECRFHTEVPWLSDETQPKDRNSRSPDIRSGPEVGARKPHSAGFV